MKTLRQISAATILSLMLTISVFAGDIHCPGTASTGTSTASSDPITTVILTVVTVVY